MPADVKWRATGDTKHLQRALVRSENEVDKLKGKLREVGRAGKASGSQMQTGFAKAASSIKNMAMGFLGAGGVLAGIRTASQAWQVYMTNVREASAETTKAINESIAFAALQEGGTKAARVHEAARLGARYGITDRGQVWNIVQALQSIRDSYPVGLKAAEAVFAGAQVGIPVEMGAELEVLGVGQKQAPGAAIRRAYVAGQASGRDPATLAQAAAGLSFWKDPDVGFASAAVIAESVRREQLMTYVKAAGKGLSRTSAPAFQETLKRLGVAEGTRMEKMQALAAAGLDTIEELQLAGLTEQRQAQGVAAVVTQVGKVERIRDIIARRAVPGILQRHRAEIEEELPLAKGARELDMLRAMAADEQALGVSAAKFQQRERKQRIQGLAFRRLGLEQAGPFDLIEEGRTTRWDQFQYALWGLLSGKFDLTPGAKGKSLLRPKNPWPSWNRIEEEMQAIRDELEAARPSTERIEPGDRLGTPDIEGAVERGTRRGNTNRTLGNPDREPP